MPEKESLTLAQKLDLRINLVLFRRQIVDMEFSLAVIGIVVMVVEAELYINQSITKRSLVSLMLKFLISISTLLLLVFVCVGYYISARIRALDSGEAFCP